MSFRLSLLTKLRRHRSSVRWLLALAVAGSTLLALPAPAGAVAPDSRHVTIVAGIHDTAVNDCDGDGTTSSPAKEDVNAVGETVDSPLFPPGVKTVRVTMPWDVADPGLAMPGLDMERVGVVRTCMDAWLKAVFAKRLTPEIDFRGDRYFAEGGQVLMPTLAQYEEAMEAFVAAYVNCAPGACEGGDPVTVIAPWNEPDNAGSNAANNVYNLRFQGSGTHLAGKSCPANPTASNCGAVMAAQMWVVDHQLMNCSGCTVVAGDFSANQGLRKVKGGACPNGCVYLKLYDEHLSGMRPGHWAVHPYTDIENYQHGAFPPPPVKLKAFAAKLQQLGYGTGTFIWLNEISVCATADGGTCGHLSHQNGKLAAMQYLLGSLPLEVGPSGPQVGRIDYYCFLGGEGRCTNNWALVEKGASTCNPAGQVFAMWADRNTKPDDRACTGV